MSSRQEEKERRRQERLAAEEAAKKSESRRSRISIVLGALIAVAAVIAVVVAVAAGGGDGDEHSPDESGSEPSGQAKNPVPIPEQRISDYEEAAKAAGCTLNNPKNEGSTHVADSEKVEYGQNPPTSGNHHQNPAQDGNYVGIQSPAPENHVHSLEHGRIIYQYKPGTPQQQIGQLESLFEENDGYHILLIENPTGMDAAVAATAWDHSLTCPEFNDKVFDAMRTFRDRYVDQGPELVP